MTDAQITTVKGYVAALGSDIEDGELLDLVVGTVADRVLLYLNETEVSDSLLRVIAQVVVGAYKRTVSGADREVASVSDNGQTVSYVHSRITGDTELFDGFEKLLAPYRRVHVITG